MMRAIVPLNILLLLVFASPLQGGPDLSEKISLSFASSLYQTEQISQTLTDHLHDSIVTGDGDITRQEMLDILVNARVLLGQMDQDSRTALPSIHWEINRVPLENAKNISGFFHTMSNFKPADQVFTLRPRFSEKLRDSLDAINMYAERIILVVRAIDGTPKIVGFSADL